MNDSTPHQLRFPSSAGFTVRADFEGGAVSSDFGALLLLLTAVNERWNLASTSKQQSGVTVLVFPFGTIYCGFNWRPAGLPAGGLRSKVPSGKRSAAGLGSAVWMGR